MNISNRGIFQTHTILLIIGLFLVALFAIPHEAHAATITWDGGGGDNNWSTCANWDNADTCPGSTDNAVFDGTSTKNATIDTNTALWNLNMNSGYTGTITQSADLDLRFSFTQFDGTYTWSSGAFNVGRDFDADNGATLNLTGATVTFDTSEFTDLFCTGTFGADSTVINKTSGGDFRLGAGCTLVDPTITEVDDFHVSGTLDPPSSMTASDLNINSTGSVTFDPSDTLTLSASIDNDGSLTLPNAPTFLSYSGTGTTTHPGTTWGGSGNVSVNTGGTLDFNNATSWTVNFVTVNSSATLNYTSGTSWDVNGDFTNDGTINYSGSTLNAARTLNVEDGTFDLSGTDVTFDSSNSALLYCTGTFSANSTVINKPSGNFTLRPGCTLSGATITDAEDMFIHGTLDSPSSFDLGSGDLTLQSGSSATFINSLTINGFTSYIDIDLSTLATINGTITLNSDADVSLSTSTLSTSSTVDINGTSSFTFSGTTFDVGTINLESGTALSVVNVTDWTNSGNMTIDGTVTAGSITSFQTGTTLDLTDGTFDLTGVDIVMGGGSGTSFDLTCGTGNIDSTTNIRFQATTGGATVGGSTIRDSCTIGDLWWSGKTDFSGNSGFGPTTLTIHGSVLDQYYITSGQVGDADTTMVFAGTGNQTITLQSSSDWQAPLQVNKTSGSVSLVNENLSSGTTCTIIEGTFDTDGLNFTCTGGLTVEDGGTLELHGSETVTTPTLNSGSIVQYTGDGDAAADTYTINDWSYDDLTIASVDAGDTFDATGIATLDITDAFTHSEGIFEAPAVFEVAGNFTRSGGTFNHNSGEVDLNGSAQTISGDTTFYDLTKTTASTDTLTWTAGDTQTIANTMTLQGAASNVLSLLSSSSGSSWTIDPQGTRTISYLYVQDSTNTNATEITVDDTIEDGGNNVGWDFNDPPSAPTSLGPTSLVDGSYTADTTPTFTFTLDDPDDDDLSYTIEIDDSSDFSSLVVDYTSATAAEGSFSFTVGQAAGGGTYAEGSGGQELPESEHYYWRVLATDTSDESSSYTTANGGDIAFKVDIDTGGRGGGKKQHDPPKPIGPPIKFRLNNPPVIIALGPDPLAIEEGFAYREFGARAHDFEDGNITDEIEISGFVDTQTPGTYTIHYSITDSGDLTSRTTRTVIVEAKEAPEDIPICGNNIVEVGEECDGSANCTDDCTIEEVIPPPPPVCGNNIVEVGEECDGEENCTDDCTIEEPLLPFCGDEIVNQDHEQCDPPDGDACTITCQVAYELDCENGIDDDGDGKIDGDDDDCPQGETESQYAPIIDILSGKVGDAARDIVLFIEGALDDPQVETTTDVVETAGILLAGGFSLLSLGLTPLTSIFAQLRIGALSLFGLRTTASIRKTWGTIYDSKTKQPLDPVHITAHTKNGEETKEAFTDLDGRYGFLLPQGTYTLHAEKTHYTFPSEHVREKDKDLFYDNLYFGGTVTIEDEEEPVVAKNIPMDPTGFDWNEYIKSHRKEMKFFSALSLKFYKGLSLVYYVGFTLAAVIALAEQSLPALLILLTYVVVFILRYIDKTPTSHASLIDKETHQPLSFAHITIFNEDGYKMKDVVADHLGRFYCLVRPGKYYLEVRRFIQEDTYTDPQRTHLLSAKKGIINGGIGV